MANIDEVKSKFAIFFDELDGNSQSDVMATLGELYPNNKENTFSTANKRRIELVKQALDIVCPGHGFSVVPSEENPEESVVSITWEPEQLYYEATKVFH